MRRLVRKPSCVPVQSQGLPLRTRRQRQSRWPSSFWTTYLLRDYAFAILLAEELERIRDGKPFYVFHEYLAEVNEGFWLRDFQWTMLVGAWLGLCSRRPVLPLGRTCTTELEAALAKRDLDPIEQEEAADLLGNRYFRASILCRADAPRASTPHRELLEELHIATSLRAESDPFGLTEGVVEKFFCPGGRRVTWTRRSLRPQWCCWPPQWPRGMLLEALYQQASNMLAAHGCEVPTALDRSSRTS